MVQEKKMHGQKSIVNHTMNKVGGRKGKLRKTERQKDSKLYHLSETVSEKSFPWFPMMETVAYILQVLRCKVG